MRKISLVLIITVLLILFWLIFTHVNKQEIVVTNEFQIDKMTKPDLVKNLSNKTLHKENVIRKKEHASNKSEITTYNEDPSINKWLIYSKHQYCFDLMSPQTKISSLRLTNVFNKSLQEKKKIRLKEYRKICEEVSQQYPEFSFEKEFDFSDLNAINATSPFGKRLLDKNLNRNEAYTLNDKIADIKSTSADLFLSGNYLFYMNYQEVFQKDLFNILQSNNPNYVVSIYNYAQDLYACLQGAECGKYSTIVLNKCIMNDAFCVDDFETLIKTKLTMGQQADIAIVLAYIENLFADAISQE